MSKSFNRSFQNFITIKVAIESGSQEQLSAMMFDESNRAQRSSAASTHQWYRRQVPQEWAHAKEIILVDKMLKIDNPLNISHPIFSLLGKKAAADVGVASIPCKSKKMDSPEIERLIQHQDAASDGAAENNKKSALLAALSKIKNNNGRGESCDDDKDTVVVSIPKSFLLRT
ncbi:hypothetical protein KEM48_009704 [Puccinia striiformis f. sp. tritici PST-130]|nr:hypothetical protein KEM48_009704 [Puccinia striiformis f. sp. tritici PST-130]